MNAVLEKPQRKRSAKIAPATPTAPHGVHIRGALSNLRDLLERAWQTDDVEQVSGDSNRLLGAAATMAKSLHLDHSSPSNFEGALYDIAAQVKAALLVPGDTPSSERMVLVGQIGVVLSDLLDDPLVMKNWGPQAGPTSSKSPAMNVKSAFNFAEDAVGQAFIIARQAVEDSGSDAEWGAVRLIEWLDDKFEQAGNGSGPTEESIENLSSHLASAIAVVGLVKDENVMLGGVETILTAAKGMIDTTIEAILTEFLGKGGSHG